jgi:glycosyltransferase involved in cell wall biosynthesis
VRIGLLTSIGETLDAFFPDMIRNWTGQGHEVFPAAGTAAAKIPSTVIHGLSRRPGTRNIQGVVNLRSWVSFNDLDVVVTNTATVSALMRLCGTRVPIVYFCHGLHWNIGNAPSERIWRATERILAERTTSAIVINSDDEAWFVKLLGSDRVMRSYAGVGVLLDDYRRTELPASSRLELVWIGEFIERKRPLDVLKVARELGAMGVHYRLRMLGDGPLFERVYTEIRHHGLVNSVFAVGRAPSPPALATSHALVHTAAWEGLPRVGLEAACVGRRIYAYDVKGVRDCPNAILVGNRDAAGLARAIAMDFRSEYMGYDADVANLDSIKVAEAILRFVIFSAVMSDGRALKIWNFGEHT